MTRKDYIAIADALVKCSGDQYSESIPAFVALIGHELCKVFEEDNSNFSRGMFMEYLREKLDGEAREHE